MWSLCGKTVRKFFYLYASVRIKGNLSFIVLTQQLFWMPLMDNVREGSMTTDGAVAMVFVD